MPRLVKLGQLLWWGITLTAATSCTTADAGAVDTAAVADGAEPPPEIAALPENVDLLVRLPVAELGEPVGNAFVDKQSFDPHQSPYSPPEFSDLDTSQGFPRIDDPEAIFDDLPDEDETNDRQVEARDWAQWPVSIKEFGARLVVSALLHNLSMFEIFDQLPRLATQSHRTVLPPLDVENVNGPAWIGYSVDDRTRSFYDWADPGPATTTDSTGPWRPHIRTTIAIPLASASDHVDRYRRLCLDDDIGFCDRLIDVRAIDETLIIEMMTADGGDEDFEMLAKAPPETNSEAGGLLQRLGRQSLTPGLHEFLNSSGPGYYTRVDGLRRLAVAEYLSDQYGADDQPYDRLATMMRGLRVRAYGDLRPRRDDFTARANIEDDGVFIETRSFYTENAEETEGPEADRSLPGPDLERVDTVYGTWRIDIGDSTLHPAGTGTDWELSVIDTPDQIEWLQGIALAAMANPAGLETALVADGGTELSSLFDQLADVSPDRLAEIGAIFDRTLRDIAKYYGLDTPAALTSLLKATGSQTPTSAAVAFVGHPTTESIRRLEDGLAVEFYFDDPSITEFLELFSDQMRRYNRRERRTDIDLDATVIETDELITLRLAADIPVDLIDDEPVYGPAGGDFEWAKTTGNYRRRIDRSFTETFQNSFPPERIRWRRTDGDESSGTRIEFGPVDDPPSTTSTPTEVSRPTVDENMLCAASVQARIAGLFDAGGLWRMDIETKQREFFERRRRRYRLQQPRFRSDATGSALVDEAIQTIQLPLSHALATAEFHTTVRADLDDVVDSLNQCGGNDFDGAERFGRAADRWSDWKDELLDVADH